MKERKYWAALIVTMSVPKIAYSVTASSYHWMVALPLIGSVGSVLQAQQAPKPEKGKWMWRHKSLGLLTGMVVTPRLAYRLFNSQAVGHTLNRFVVSYVSILTDWFLLAVIVQCRKTCRKQSWARICRIYPLCTLWLHGDDACIWNCDGIFRGYVRNGRRSAWLIGDSLFVILFFRQRAPLLLYHNSRCCKNSRKQEEYWKDCWPGKFCLCLAKNTKF